MPMRERVKDLVKQGDKLFSSRVGLHSLWQQIAENFHPFRADFTRVRYMSEEFASYLMTGRPALAHRDLSNALPALMRPRERQWLWARTYEDDINEDREARGWLDWASKRLYRLLYDPRSCFVRSCKEGDGDYAAFGQAVFSLEPNEWVDGFLVRTWHLRDVAWTEDERRSINQVHRIWKPSARDLAKRFPKTIDPKVERLLKDNPDKAMDCRHIVVPADDYDLPVKNRKRCPFVSIYVDVENDTILDEQPCRTMIYVIPRWATISGSQYAYSPATVYGLPDARMLQQITLTMLEAGQKAVDPPMVATQEAINGGTNLYAGGMNWVDADYDERMGEVLRPITMRFDGIKYGAEREDKIVGQIDATFFLNQIRVPQVTKEMTAYEAQKLYEEFQRNSLPLLEPIETEYNGGLCSRGFEVAMQLGLLGSPYDMPQVLRGRELRWQFDTPLQAAAETQKVFTFQQCVQIATEAGQIDPSAVINFDLNKATRAALIAAGGSDWLLDERQVAQLRQQQAQIQERASAANQIAHGADVATRVAGAAESAGKAATALQGAGIGQ